MTKHYTHEEIEALLDASTPGEWRAGRTSDESTEIWSINSGEKQIAVVTTDEVLWFEEKADLDLTLKAPAIISQLLDENRAMREKLADAKAADPLSQVPAFDWGSDGEQDGHQIEMDRIRAHFEGEAKKQKEYFRDDPKKPDNRPRRG